MTNDVLPSTSPPATCCIERVADPGTHQKESCLGVTIVVGHVPFGGCDQLDINAAIPVWVRSLREPSWFDLSESWGACRGRRRRP